MPREGTDLSSLAMDDDLRRMADLDDRLVQAAKDIKVLSHLTWPEEARVAFLRDWQAGNPRLPRVEIPYPDHAERIAALDAIGEACDPDHPVGAYLLRTARSYAVAARMLQAAGTPEFTTLSGAIYGLPGDPIGPSGFTSLQAADHFLQATRGFANVRFVSKAEYCVMPQHVGEELQRAIDAFFTRHPVKVVVDPDLAPKAAAGARTVRIRGATCFSPLDVGQLLQHEVFVHTATKLNGREQPHLKSLGLGAPRTAGVQEGLATLAELITATIDLARLERIALRIRAVHRALEGADFIEVFRFFLEAGQDEDESFHSAMRVFRGGDVRGRVAFTKDVVYLHGLIFTHTFLRKAIQAEKPEYSRYLFAGRLTLGDVIALEPFFRSGFVAPPLYEPAWVANRRALAAYLIYSAFVNRIGLDSIRLEDFADEPR